MKSIKIATIRIGLCVVLLIGLLLAAPAWAAQNDLIVKSAGGVGLWMSQVQTDTPGVNGKVVTVIRFRPTTSEGWAEVARLPGRATSIAVRGTQLAVLQESGDWSLLWPEGSALGPSLANKGRILALAGDGDTLWAIALVSGPLPSTQPATTSSTAPAVEKEVATTQPAAKTVLLRLSPAGWTTLGPIDIPADAVVEMAVSRNRVYTAVKRSGQPTQVYEGTSPMVSVKNPFATRFALLSAEDGSILLWTSKDSDAGQLIRLTTGLTGGMLANPTGLVGAAPRTVEISTGRLRLFFLQVIDGKSAVMEQKYDLKTLAKIDAPSALVFPSPRGEAKYQNILSAVVLAAMVFAMIASFQHRRSLRELLEKANHPIPAPLGARLIAGAIDLLPMLAAMFAIYLTIPLDADPTIAAQDPRIEAITGVGIIVYLLHTTLIEAIFGRTVGKMLMGLKVVDFEGKPASVGARVARNLLRIIELMIPPMAGLMIVSPLRQRAGDIAAGTLVVSAKAPAAPPPLP